MPTLTGTQQPAGRAATQQRREAEQARQQHFQDMRFLWSLNELNSSQWQQHVFDDFENVRRLRKIIASDTISVDQKAMLNTDDCWQALVAGYKKLSISYRVIYTCYLYHMHALFGFDAARSATVCELLLLDGGEIFRSIGSRDNEKISYLVLMNQLLLPKQPGCQLVAERLLQEPDLLSSIIESLDANNKLLRMCAGNVLSQLVDHAAAVGLRSQLLGVIVTKYGRSMYTALQLLTRYMAPSSIETEAFRNHMLAHHQLGLRLEVSELNLVLGKVRSVLAAGSSIKRCIVMDFLVKFIGSYQGHARAKAIYDLDIDVYLTMNLESKCEQVKVVAMRLLTAYIRFLPQKLIAKNKSMMYAATVSAVAALSECKTVVAFGVWLECMHDALLRLRSPKALGLKRDKALVHVRQFRQMKRYISHFIQQFFAKHPEIADECRQHEFYYVVNAICTSKSKHSKKVLQLSIAVNRVGMNSKGKQNESNHIQRQRYSSSGKERVLPVVVTPAGRCGVLAGSACR